MTNLVRLDLQFTEEEAANIITILAPHLNGIKFAFDKMVATGPVGKDPAMELLYRSAEAEVIFQRHT